jgi:hippurate hydrolase
MPIVNRVAAVSEEIAGWRRELHAQPELDYDVHLTAEFVRRKLLAFGCDEVVPGIGRTGVVGVIKGKGSSDGVVGLRADMDALPINETTGKPWASRTAGKMHACGHDGHTAMLLGAARHLAETRNFSGTAVVIFQPAEEGGGGARAMLDDGLVTRFGIGKVFGMHNMPGLPVGSFAIRHGAIMAAADRFTIAVEGRGAHAALPHLSVDTVLVASQIVVALQSIVARNVDPLQSAVLSVSTFHAGDAFNVLPQTAELRGTVRTLRKDVQALVERRMREVVEGVAALHGGTARLDYAHGYPVTVNHDAETDIAAAVAGDVVGPDRVITGVDPIMGAEDFSYMLEARPGAFIFVGNGSSAGLHNPNYDFDDTAIPVGTSYWVRLVETLQPA